MWVIPSYCQSSGKGDRTPSEGIHTTQISFLLRLLRTETSCFLFSQRRGDTSIHIYLLLGCAVLPITWLNGETAVLSYSDLQITLAPYLAVSCDDMVLL